MAYEREAAVLREFGRVSRGLRAVLAQMDKEDRLILEKMFLNPKYGNLDSLCEILGVEKTTVYRRRDRALGRFARLWNDWEWESGWEMGR